MSAREGVLSALGAMLPELHVQFGVCRLWLFGSLARGEDTEQSDVNVLVEFDRPASLFTLAQLRRSLEERLGREVEVGTPESLSRASRDRVLGERILVT